MLQFGDKALGEVAEWLKAPPWKGGIGETLSWVQIPPSPPRFTSLLDAIGWRY